MSASRRRPSPLERVFAAGGGSAAALLAWVRDGMARAIIRARVPPNALTLAGPVALAVVFIPLLRGDAGPAGWLGTVGTDYARARAEKLSPGCAVGFFERPERVVTVIVGLLAGNLHMALLVSAAFTNLIAAQRILYTRAVLEGREPTGRFAYWDYPRGSAQHTALSFPIFLLLVFGHHLIPRPL